jgi:hypothetical protein
MAAKPRLFTIADPSTVAQDKLRAIHLAPRKISGS